MFKYEWFIPALQLIWYKVPDEFTIIALSKTKISKEKIHILNEKRHPLLPLVFSREGKANLKISNINLSSST